MRRLVSFFFTALVVFLLSPSAFSIPNWSSYKYWVQYLKDHPNDDSWNGWRARCVNYSKCRVGKKYYILKKDGDYIEVNQVSKSAYDAQKAMGPEEVNWNASTGESSNSKPSPKAAEENAAPPPLPTQKTPPTEVAQKNKPSGNSEAPALAENVSPPEQNKDFISPIKQSCWINSSYGCRFHPELKYYRMHRGVDIKMKTGTPVQTVGRGCKVTHVGTRGGFGKSVKINCGGTEFAYNHLSRYAKIRVGMTLKQGQVLGYVGSTGLSTGPHLDFQTFINGKDIDPVKFYKGAQNICSRGEAQPGRKKYCGSRAKNPYAAPPSRSKQRSSSR